MAAMHIRKINSIRLRNNLHRNFDEAKEQTNKRRQGMGWNRERNIELQMFKINLNVKQVNNVVLHLQHDRPQKRKKKPKSKFKF